MKAPFGTKILKLVDRTVFITVGSDHEQKLHFDAVAPDTESANLLANKIRDVSTEKPVAAGATPDMAATISGRVYRFPPNAINVKMDRIERASQPTFKRWQFTGSLQ